MKILAIETSCDETGISIIDASGTIEGGDVHFTVLADTLTSQAKLHSKYGGVYPMLAKREHVKALPILLEQAISKYQRYENSTHSHNSNDIDAIAITNGPGLEPALWTGINFAQELAKKWSVPLVPVNHMEGHIFSALMEKQDKDEYTIQNFQYPAITLLISGGHTDLYLIKDQLQYERLGGTVDDAVGEAFDKVARMLGLGYPGGPIIEKLAEEYKKSHTTTDIGKPFPRPMMHSGDLNFSFSGLKTAVLYKVKDIKKLLAVEQNLNTAEYDKAVLPDNIIKAITSEFSDACAEVLAYKVVKAVQEHNTDTVIIGGGVSASSHITETIMELLIKKTSSTKVYIPEKKMSGDNALMIAIAGYLRAKHNEYLQSNTKLKANGRLLL